MLRVCLRRTVRRKPSNNFDRNFPAPWILTLELFKSRRRKQLLMAEILHHPRCEPNFITLKLEGLQGETSNTPSCMTWHRVRDFSHPPWFNTFFVILIMVATKKETQCDQINRSNLVCFVLDTPRRRWIFPGNQRKQRARLSATDDY